MKDPARFENSQKVGSLGKRGNIKWNWLHLHSKKNSLRENAVLWCISKKDCWFLDQGAILKIIWCDEPKEQRKLRASRVSSLLRVKHYCPTIAKHFKKETKLGASVVIIPTRREGLAFCFFWINWTQFFNMNSLIDEGQFPKISCKQRRRHLARLFKISCIY